MHYVPGDRTPAAHVLEGVACRHACVAATLEVLEVIMDTVF